MRGVLLVLGIGDGSGGLEGGLGRGIWVHRHRYWISFSRFLEGDTTGGIGDVEDGKVRR
jgi:hypothetical protein